MRWLASEIRTEVDVFSLPGFSLNYHSRQVNHSTGVVGIKGLTLYRFYLILLHLGGKYSTENGKIASYIMYQLILTGLN